jgi:hypothetical protein
MSQRFPNVNLISSLTESQAAGIIIGIFMPLFLQTHVICLPSGRPISSDLIGEALEHANLDNLSTAPSILEDLSQSPDTLERLSRLKSISYGGGKIAHPNPPPLVPGKPLKCAS